MEVLRVCRKCGEVNEVNSGNLIREDVYDEWGEYYRVMYFDCKRCKERNAVQIDDTVTLKMFRELRGLITRNAKKRAKGEEIKKKDARKVHRMMKELKEERKRLEEKRSGINLLDENKNIVIKQLTFPKDGDIIESNL